MAITVQMREQVSQLYVALFGRAPDGEGLGYWVGQLDAGKTMVDVANTMYATAPARVLYPSFLTNEEIIGNFYTNVLGRTADAEGLLFWTAKLNAAGATAGSVIAEMINVVANYSGTDPAGLTSQALFNNKVAVAQWYGEQNGNIAGANTVLTAVTSDPASVDAAKTGGAQSGETYTLTTGTDAVVGTSGNDTIVGNDTTFTVFDEIDGGAGTDTFNWTNAAAVTAVPGATTVKNVENIVIKNSAAFAANISSWTGATNVTITAADTSKAVDLTTAAASVSVVGGTNVKVTDGSTAADQVTTVSVNGNLATKAVLTGKAISTVSLSNTAVATDITNAAATGKATLALTLDNVTAGATSVITDTANEYKTINVTASGKASSTKLAGTAATDLTVAGAANLTLDASGLTNLATVTLNGSGNFTSASLNGGTVTAINAAASTGTNTVTMDATKATYVGGSGIDTLKLAAVPTKSVDGGAGAADVLELAAVADLSTVTSTALANAKNFEILGLSGAYGTNADAGKSTLDLSALGTAFTGVQIDSTTAAENLILSNASAATSLTFLAAPAKTTTLNLKTNGATDSLALTVGAATSAAIDLATASDIIAAGQDTVTVVANADTSGGAVQHKVKIALDEAASMTVSGKAGVDFTGSTFTKLATVTSTSEGAIKVALTQTTADSSVTTGAGDDTIVTAAASTKAATVNAGNGNNSVTTGAGNDVITSGSGNDTIDAKGGNNTIVAGDGTNSITVGDGNNTITGGTGVDTINVGSGANNLTLGAGNDVVVFTKASASSAIFTTITSVAAGDVLNFAAVGALANVDGKLGAALTSGVNDYQTFLNAAAGKGAGVVSWFQFGGDTYIVEDVDTGGAFLAGTDHVVKIVGLVDLSNSVIDQTAETLTIA